ncbi:hypothetical protein [Aquimarina sp. RZ0]|uniref:hypothetical protein n=1 Tax=Aquimarina sp. RZ0 TaxID=2607730 RepID=UPI0011F39069|nr:hypothetical protein [Aquimarina sp. RZ0]KAA1247322.1 hypothetical protein F0000_04025 [Aquimarina sp. RZ0]
MKKLFLLLLMVGAGFTTQAQINSKDTDWRVLKEEQEKLYSLATDISEMTDKVVAQDNTISFLLKSGTVSLETKKDNSKAKEAYIYTLLTSQGRAIKLDKGNASDVIDSFRSKLLILKEQLKANNGKEVDDILKGLFN